METERFEVHRVNRKRRATRDESGEGFWAHRKGVRSVRDETGKGEVTFSGDRPTNRNIIESKIFMYFYYIPGSLIDFPSLYIFILFLFDLHFPSLIYLSTKWKSHVYIEIAIRIDLIEICVATVENIIACCNLHKINIKIVT